MKISKTFRYSRIKLYKRKKKTKYKTMPFLGQDWRSSGDEWIKTEQGWERIKVLESILHNINDGYIKKSLLLKPRFHI